MIRQLFYSLLKCRLNRDLRFFPRQSVQQLIQQNKGVAIALSILCLWALTTALAFSIGARTLGLWSCLLLTPWLTFLYTGLFVTGHDAMHASVAPQRPRLNRIFGELTLFLYGLIPYDKLHQAHAQHHRHPASEQDPDFHDGHHTHPLLWYLRFMRRYWTLRQTIGLVLIYNSLYRLMGIPEANLLMFWALPSLLSSVQLFYFGTYLGHRRLPETYLTPLRSNSYYLPWLLSLVTCYHFGYHREHHEFPHVPWWQLPQMAYSQTARSADYISSTNQRYTSGGRALATINSPFVQRDRTRLKT